MELIQIDDATSSEPWQPLWEVDPWQYPLYTPLHVAYSKAYAETCTYTDQSFVVVEKGSPILGAIVALGVHQEGRSELSGFGRPILYLEAPDSHPTHKKKALRLLSERFDHLVEAHGISLINYREYGPTLSGMGRYLLEKGGQATPHFTQLLDLTTPATELRQQVRRSVKTQLNWGEKNLRLRLADAESVTEDDIDRFRALHFEVAGRRTRSYESWQRQYQMVRADDAFMVLGYLDDELVTSALFEHSNRYCYYGASASNRDRFDLPILHYPIWAGILHMQQRGCRYFDMGERLYPDQGHPSPTPKELGISHFKGAFGGQTYIRQDILWKP